MTAPKKRKRKRKRKRKTRTTTSGLPTLPRNPANSPKYSRTALEDLDPKKQVECWFHFPSFCHHFLKIWTKPDADGNRHLIPFKWNRAQKYAWSKRKRRNYYIKSRQVGHSTLECAEDFHIAVSRPASNVTLLTHSAELCDAMRDKIQTFLDHMPEGFEIKVTKNNRDGFKFAGVPGLSIALKSNLNIMTVSGKHKGIGKTLDKLHMTEVSRWEDVSGGVDSYIATAVQALPKSVTVSIETTPNGLGHPSYALWKKAVSGAWGFEPIFMPWWLDDTAVRFAELGLEPENAKEKWLVKRGATPEHIAFRREKLREMDTPEFSGEVMFDQEYPSDPRSCFISGGKNAFSIGKLLEQEILLKKEQVAWKNEGRRFPRVGSLALRDDGSVYLSEQPDGPFDLYEFPRIGEYYVIGADAGKGKDTGDPSAACVLGTGPMRQVAEFKGKPYPQEFAHLLSRLGHLYNKALLIPERTHGEGDVVTMDLLGMDYPNIYYSQKHSRGFLEDAFSYGWHNNAATRALIITEARNVILEGKVRIRSLALLEELQGFTADKAGKYQAPQGSHDDLAMAFMLAVWATQHGAFKPMETTVQGEDPLSEYEQQVVEEYTHSEDPFTFDIDQDVMSALM